MRDDAASELQAHGRRLERVRPDHLRARRGTRRIPRIRRGARRSDKLLHGGLVHREVPERVAHEIRARRALRQETGRRVEVRLDECERLGRNGLRMQ